MLLSKLLKTYDVCAEYEIVNEKEFDTLALAGGKVDLKFCTFLESEKYLEQLSSNAVMIFTKKALCSKLLEKGKGVCIVDNPRIAFFSLHNCLQNLYEYRRPDKPNEFGENCQIHKSTYIAEKNVRIGNNVVIEEFVSIKENTIIGDNCVIRAGSIIGGEGFEHKRNGEDVLSVKHLGGVIIEDNVEFQQGNFVDKAIYPWDDTIIGENSKTDNNVHIAHADKIGKRVFIAASTCIAGRVEIGNDVWIGPGVTVTNGISIGDKAHISIGSVVTKSVKGGEKVTGNFAIEHAKFINYLRKIR